VVSGDGREPEADEVLHRLDFRALRLREEPVELCERTLHRRPRRGEPEALRRKEPDDHHQRLFVAEHQRGQLEAAAKPVPAGRTPLRLDRDAHVLEPGDVSAHCPRAHLEPACHLLGSELAVHLE
jgi:hypothetical protein